MVPFSGPLNLMREFREPHSLARFFVDHYFVVLVSGEGSFGERVTVWLLKRRHSALADFTALL